MAMNAAAASTTHDPSMDEILASIRKIIADDTLGTRRDEPPARRALPEAQPIHDDLPEEEAVLDLGSMGAPSPVHAEVASARLQPSVAAQAPRMQGNVPQMAPAPVSAASSSSPLLSEAASTLVSKAFDGLIARTSAAPRPVAAQVRSLEDVVVEALRPMLEQWINDNLPTLVERLVKAEISRLTRAE